MIPDKQKVIDDYKAAFRRANGEDCIVDYSRGWFTIRNSEYTTGTKHRWREMVKFTDTLLSRPALVTARQEARR